MKATKRQEDLIKKLTKKLETLCDKDDLSKSEALEADELGEIISVFETLHYPITDCNKKHSKIIKELFYELK